MKHFSEAVLDGHPDRFCDLIADRIMTASVKQDPEAFAQIEASIWRDQVFLTGTIATSRPLELDTTTLIRTTGLETGYRPGNRIDATRFQVTDHITRLTADPRRWISHCNDQCVIKGYAGYDQLTGYLPPEHFAAWFFRDRLIRDLSGGPLNGYGPDGKVLVVTDELPAEWRITSLVVTLQQPQEENFTVFVERMEAALRVIHGELLQHDPRWCGAWGEVKLLINPNGPLVEAGPYSDNGQTGRKLVMDHYGPRIPIGGGALYGKHVTHIDRLGAVEARRFCLELVKAGSAEARVTIAYAPGCPVPLETLVQSNIRPDKDPTKFFTFNEMMDRVEPGLVSEVNRMGFNMLSDF